MTTPTDSHKNDITTNLTNEIQALHTLRNLKAQLEAYGITEELQHNIDTIILTTYDNIELQNIKAEIIEKYNSLEKDYRTFLNFTYPSISDKKNAQLQYNEIIKFKKRSIQNDLSLEERQEILYKINNMSFIIQNIAPTLYEIDTNCKTYNGKLYSSFDELTSAIAEEAYLDEFIKIDEILDEIKEASSIYNIRRKISEIEKHSYHNTDIKNKISDIKIKLDLIENEFKTFNGKRYSTIEEVENIKDELYYIDTEAYKFDLLSKDGLKLFLELMSLRQFESNEAKEILNTYRSEYMQMKDIEIAKETKTQKDVLKAKRKKKLKIFTLLPAITFTALMLTVISGFFAGFSTIWPFIATAGLLFGISIPIAIFYAIYYNITNGVDLAKEKLSSLTKKKKK
ncbi:MAG: hypothetical protein ACRC41_07550 [Sarcina sp.]